MAGKYSGMDEFKSYMNDAMSVGKQIIEKTGTLSISRVHKDIDAILYPLSSGSGNDINTLQGIVTTLDEEIQANGIRQKCPDLEGPKQVPCMLNQLYFAALRLEVLRHLTKSKGVEPSKNTCQTYHATTSSILGDYRKLREAGASFDEDVIEGIMGLYTEDTKNFFGTACSLDDILEELHYP